MNSRETYPSAQGNENARRAAAFLHEAGLSRLLGLLREKYIQVGHVGGQVTLEQSTQNERRNIASFLGRAAYPDSTLKIKLADVEKALQHSFQCSLPDTLAAFFPGQPLVTRPAQRLVHAQRQADFREALLSLAAELPEESRAHAWLLHGPHGIDWLFSRHKNAPPEEQERQLGIVRYIVRVLEQLPLVDAPERLALFAQRTSGDPHALDTDRPAGRLLLLALGDLQGETNATASPPQDRAHMLRLYSNAGLLVDTISSSVAAFNLASAIRADGMADPLVEAAGRRVLLLPLRQVLEWPRIAPAREHIYVVENPQVFEEIIASQEVVRASPTLVCTSGWPSAAALMLLDRLLAESPDHQLFYSGDFDLKGLQIAAYLLARYPGRCSLWQFDTAAYLLALQADGVPAGSAELDMLGTLPAVFTLLVAAMQEKRVWAYQEGIARSLTEDIITFFSFSDD